MAAACVCVGSPDVGEGSRDRNWALLLISDCAGLSGCAGGNFKEYFGNVEMYTLFKV